MIQDTSAARCSGSVPSALHSPSQHLAPAVIHAPPFPTHLLQNPSVCLSSHAFIHLSLLSQRSRCMGKEAPGLKWSWGKPLSQPVTQHSCYLMSLADRNRLACQRSWLRGSLCRGVPCLCTLPLSMGRPRPRGSAACTSPCTHLTASSFPSAGPSNPHTEATPQKSPDIRG